MTFARLLICVGGVYSMFLIWGVAQERLSTPFNATGLPPGRWSSAIIMSAAQSFLCSIAAAAYIFIRKPEKQTYSQAFGLEPPSPPSAKQNGVQNGSAKPKKNNTNMVLILRTYAWLATIVAIAAPLGFASLSHISYPAMVLGKSCKLIPVLLLNVLLYRRKFAPYKYVVVALVTAGITMFMAFGKQKKHKSKVDIQTGSSLIGVLYLIANLFLDGLLNSSQDQVVTTYKVTGQQMMLWMNIFSFIINMALSILPLPYIPAIHPSHNRTPDIVEALAFLKAYPGSTNALLQFAFTGALGQLFIFETLAHFGSLTLVTITLTRKLFTMLLSVIIYRHKLTPGQYLGAATVFAGITLEAYIKRKDIHLKQVIKEEETAKIKDL